MKNNLTVKLTRHISASAKSCFEAWLNPETLKVFMSDCNGVAVPHVDVDAREGGNFLIMMKAGEKELPHTGQYKTVRPYTKLEFTWMSPHQIYAETLVTLDFKAIDENTTQFTLTHIGFVSEDARAGHEGGWSQITSGFEKLLNK